MKRRNARKSQRPLPATEQLKKDPSLDFITATSLMLLHLIEETRLTYHRYDPWEARNERSRLKALKELVIHCRSTYSLEVLRLEREIAQEWLQSDNPDLVNIGTALKVHDWERLAT